jgi:hypothetical protein
LKNSKTQGISPPTDLILKVKLSNQKHLEIINTLMQTLPQGERQMFQDILRLNSKVNKDLQSM